MATYTYQNVVYGDTPAAIMCALASAAQGAKTALVAPPPPGFTKTHLGGLLANGLGATDLGSYASQILGSGWTSKFFALNTGWYGSFNRQYRLEPHVAEYLFAQLIRENVHLGLDLYTEQVLASVQETGTTITSITTESGDVFTATSNFADMTYEGDLMAAKPTPISWTVGRESNTAFLAAPPPGMAWIQAQEALAGFNVSAIYNFNNFVGVDPYDGNGNLLPGVRPFPALVPGDADLGIQSMGYRVALTQNKSRMNNFIDAGADPLTLELQKRRLGSGAEFNPGKCPNGKYDWNYDWQGYTTNPALTQWAWPTATRAVRAQIAREQYVQQMSYAFFLANDASVPSSIQQDINQYGLAADEFTDNTTYTRGWPRMPYVREGRRLRGQYVTTQNDVQLVSITKPDSIGLGNYPVDSHAVANYPFNGGFIFDSNAAVQASRLRVRQPWEVSLRSVLPQVSECVNLIVGPAGSFSHMAYASYRIEKTWMEIAEACGVIIGLSAKLGTPINSLDYTTQIAPALIAAGLVLHYTPS